MASLKLLKLVMAGTFATSLAYIFVVIAGIVDKTCLSVVPSSLLTFMVAMQTMKRRDTIKDYFKVCILCAAYRCVYFAICILVLILIMHYSPSNTSLESACIVGLGGVVVGITYHIYKRELS